MLDLSVQAQQQGQYTLGGPREYENKIIAKMEPYFDVPGFEGAWGSPTQWAIDHYCADNLNGICARGFLDRILDYPEDLFENKVKACCETWVKQNTEGCET